MKRIMHSLCILFKTDSKTGEFRRFAWAEVALVEEACSSVVVVAAVAAVVVVVAEARSRTRQS